METNTVDLVAELRSKLTALEQQLAEARQVAETDSLTGLGNLFALNRRRGCDGPGWYVMADLDGFKVAQDAHPEGHAFGDRVLCEFAEFLRANCRREEDDLVARRGGDEFVLWCSSERGAQAIVDRIRAWRSSLGPVTASAGCAGSLAVADVSMYFDKRRKRAA